MITLICGHPRAGKTTYSKRFRCRVIHLDNVGSTDKVISMIRNITEDVVVEGVFYDSRKRAELLLAYKGNGSKCIFIDTPREVREERYGHKLKHDIPFPAPTYAEGWNEIIVIGENDGNIQS